MSRMPFRSLLGRLFLALAALFLWHGSALAAVQVHFHSFNGSMFAARYPHTFVVFEGTLDDTGERIYENYGFSARSATPDVLLYTTVGLAAANDTFRYGATSFSAPFSRSDIAVRPEARAGVEWAVTDKLTLGLEVGVVGPAIR